MRQHVRDCVESSLELVRQVQEGARAGEEWCTTDLAQDVVALVQQAASRLVEGCQSLNCLVYAEIGMLVEALAEESGVSLPWMKRCSRAYNALYGALK